MRGLVLPQAPEAARGDPEGGEVVAIRKTLRKELRVWIYESKGNRLIGPCVGYPGGDGEMRRGKPGLALWLDLLPKLRVALDPAER